MLFATDSVTGEPQGGEPNSSELRHRQRSESIDEWKTVWRARHDCTAGHPRLSHNLEHKIEVDCNGSRFSPPREVFFVKLTPPSGEAIVIGLSVASRAAGLCPKFP